MVEAIKRGPFTLSKQSPAGATFTGNYFVPGENSIQMLGTYEDNLAARSRLYRWGSILTLFGAAVGSALIVGHESALSGSDWVSILSPKFNSMVWGDAAAVATSVGFINARRDTEARLHEVSALHLAALQAGDRRIQAPRQPAPAAIAVKR